MRWLDRMLLWPARLLPPARRGSALHDEARRLVREVPMPQSSLTMSVETPLLLKRSRQLLDAEPDTIEWIESFDRGSVFWDVGANVGLFSMYAG